MPHIITGEIRKEPFTKEGSNNNGQWKMFAVDLSERMKIKNKDTNQDETVYTNYRAVFFANQNVISWYNEAFQAGKIVSISCETLNITSREANGDTYLTAEMIRPQLVFNQRGESQGHPQQQGQQQPRQQQSQPQPRQGNQYDDDIPF